MHIQISINEKRVDVPVIWMVLLPTKFPAAVELTGPKHSTSTPRSVVTAVVLSIDVNRVAFGSPNPATGVAVKAMFNGPLGPQLAVPADKCASVHTLIEPPTLQRVVPVVSPVTLQVKVKVSPGQVEGAGVNCPETSPENKHI